MDGSISETGQMQITYSNYVYKKNMCIDCIAEQQ